MPLSGGKYARKSYVCPVTLTFVFSFATSLIARRTVANDTFSLLFLHDGKDNHPRHHQRGKHRYDNVNHTFFSRLFFKTIHVVTTAAATAQRNAVHHHSITVYTTAEVR